MVHFTIPSRQNLEIIRTTQRIIEDSYNVRRITDYAILKGAGTAPRIFNDKNIYPYWLQNETDDYTDHDDFYYGISPAQAVAEGYYDYAYSNDNTIGTRLMLDCDTITRYGKRVKRIKNNNDAIIDIVEYGKYPQSLASDKENNMLDLLYVKGLLKKTGRTFSYNVGSVKDSFLVEEDIEYEYDNQRYVRVKKNNSNAVLTNGNKLTKDYYWVKVEPIKWYVNHDAKIAITSKILIGGVPYNIKPVDGIAHTYIGKFINEVFSKDFSQDIEFLKAENKTKISKDAISVIKNTKKSKKEINMEFGKIFDAELNKEKKKKEKKGKKVKVTKINLNNVKENTVINKKEAEQLGVSKKQKVKVK